ncbi:MAG: hypothetical protein MUC48_21570 [Leptolyngbya sp. Prado105]|nr:hypothetical protein [Leptolyngbya sp. Prado105]
MPMNRNLYPDNWKEIALAVKQAVKWRCESCDRPCRRPKETWTEFCDRILNTEELYWYAETADEISDSGLANEFRERPQRFTLTVAHLDHNPINNEPGNLRALCSGCRLAYDAEQHRKNASATRYRRREERGQLSFLAPP